MTHFPDIVHDLHAIEPTDDAAQLPLVRIRDKISTMIRELKSLAQDTDKALIECIDATGDIAISDTERLYVGTTRSTKSIDDQGILMAVLESVNGNLELITTGDGGVLASQPWKYGAVKTLLGESVTSTLFRTDTLRDVKTGSAIRSVKVSDTRYQKTQ